MEQTETIYDVIVIGAGPGGMTAALYASRSNLKTLLLERGIPGGEMNNTAEVENYPGFNSILGPELAERMYESTMQFGAEHVYGDVKRIVVDGDYRIVEAGKKTYKTRAVIIATGSYHRKLGVPGEEQYNGRGVSYCAVCDGAFFKGKKLAVVGGGDSAVEEGTYLTQFADVNIVHRRDELRAQKVIQDRAFKNEKVSFTWNAMVEEIKGDGQKVTGVVIRNKNTNEITEEAVDGVFIYVGILPQSDAFLDLGITDEEGWIITNEHMETAIPGIFAIGDVRQKLLRQITTAVGDGGEAGNRAFAYIEDLHDRLAVAEAAAETVD
ncbi:thioredoxin reductase (NADPH) [Trichococcus flocculiformis]|uniref:thioredoxin-disulfide reductase n=1 Tax=Trichococcus TaxID=82802 RepID=UPI0007A86059|nr:MULTISPECIES: thioredoxin-disulfide reductase [Trichococcus]CZQ94557.1 pyridine nucleotide-disulphide oxidoreductase class-ii [Trichococcus sp. ES5]SHF59579.1 thioredoxin reductase (NADPH) [Trichococcus flocculiformis]